MRNNLFIALATALLCACLLALHSGAAALPWQAWYCQSDACMSAHYILWHIRLPRILAALLVGAALALSGAAMQGLFRNPLVDPGIVGVSSGAGLAAALYIVFFAPLLPDAFRLYGLPGAAFIGGWGVTLVLYRLAQRQGQLHISIMLLTGIALSAFAGALTGLTVYLANDSQLRDITFWSMGSLAGLNWHMLAVLALLISIALPLIFTETRALNALALGEAAAGHIGFAVAKSKRRLIAAVALLTGSSVAFAGSIGFIGLVVPHLMRLSGGSDHRRLLPASLLAGGILLLLADTAGRTLIAPAELPIGILTALLGAPFLTWLVWKSEAKYG